MVNLKEVYKERIKKQAYFYLILMIIITTLLTWFNLNSYCIILLLLLRLIEEKPLKRIKMALTNRLFLSYVLLFLVECIGLLYTHHLSAGWKHVESKATLFAIPFILCAGVFTNQTGYKKIMTAYCYILFFISTYCLSVAFNHYLNEKNISVFFYHPLVSAISLNAIIYSIYILFGLLFLLSSELYHNRLPSGIYKILRPFLIIYFILFIVLLASKLMLIVLVILLSSFLWRKGSFKKNKLLVIITSLLFISGVCLVILTNNPIKKRYQDVLKGNTNLPTKQEFTPGTAFNGIQLRLLQWRYAFAILSDNNAWLIGVSPGDSQVLLNRKYIDANMYMGTPERKDTGFLNYNFHNQYLQEFVQSGILGLCTLLFSSYLLILLAKKTGTREAVFTILTLLIVFMTESLLELQHGLFLFTFFPFMLLYHPKMQKETQVYFGFPEATKKLTD